MADLQPAPGRVLTGFGAAMAGLVSTGIGEIEMPQLVKRCRMPVAVAAGTSILIVASSVGQAFADSFWPALLAALAATALLLRCSSAGIWVRRAAR